MHLCGIYIAGELPLSKVPKYWRSPVHICVADFFQNLLVNLARRYFTEVAALIVAQIMIDMYSIIDLIPSEKCLFSSSFFDLYLCIGTEVNVFFCLSTGVGSYDTLYSPARTKASTPSNEFSRFLIRWEIWMGWSIKFCIRNICLHVDSAPGFIHNRVGAEQSAACVLRLYLAFFCFSKWMILNIKNSMGIVI